MKKLLSLFLAFAMVFSLAMPAFAADDTRTIYFENTDNWSAVYAYAWDASGTQYLGEWPGSAMTKVEGETNIYSIEVSTAAINVIFNNGSSQTDNLTIPTDGNDLYSYGTGAWSKYVKKSSDVTASYDPVISISGVTISEHANFPGVLAVDAINKTYTITIPADLTEVGVNFTVSGQNLDKIPEDSTDYGVVFLDLAHLVLGMYYDSNTGNAVLPFMVDTDDIGTSDLQYYTDGGTTWTDTGWKVVIKQAEPEPTNVSLEVMLKAIDSSTDAEITEGLIGYWNNGAVDNFTPSSKNLLTGNNTVTFANGEVPSGYETPADISLTVTDTNGDGVGELTSNSGHASISTTTYEGETVYVIAVKLEKDETTEPDTPTLPETIYLKAEGATYATIYFYTSDGSAMGDENGAAISVYMTAVEGEEDIFSVATGSFPEGTAQIVFVAGDLVSEPQALSTVTGDTNMFTFGTEMDEYNQTLGTWGTYSPSSTDDTPAKITGVSLSGTGVTYDEGTKTYTVAHDATDMRLTVTGTNFANLTSNYMVRYAGGFSSILSDLVPGETANTVWTTVHADWFKDSNNFEIQYSTDGGTSWTGMGIYVTYDDSTKPATYTITTAGDNATVNAPASAAAGEAVTVTFTPDAGYLLHQINLVDMTNYDEISYTKSENSLTFTMPADNVFISVCCVLPGTTLDTIYYKGSWTNIRFTFVTSMDTNVGDAIGTMAESGIYKVTDIPDFAYRVQFTNLDSTEIENTGFLDIPTDGKNMYNAETGEWETYDPSQTPGGTTSANIVWGSMSFTYTDGENGAEGAWSNDGSEGAGTVTVTNTGTTTFTAVPSYTAVADYDEIEGSFDVASAELTAETSETFTLTLKNQPAKAITAGTKIGTVTITIN